MSYKQKNIRLYSTALAMLILTVAILATACSNADEVVASVNGEPISKDELYDVLVKQGGQQALEMIIMKKILRMESDKQEIQISEEDVGKEIEEMAEQYGGEEAFNQIMNMYGYDVEDIKEDVKMSLMIEGLIKPRIDISQDEIKEYFDKNMQEFEIEEQVEVNHILVETEDIAAEVKGKLDDGADFAELAKEYSTDESTKDFGGALGAVKRGEMVTEFEKAAFSLQEGGISQPVNTEYGYHIIQVKGRIEAQEADFEQSRGEIEKILLNSRLQPEFNEWYQEKLDEYEIESFIN